ncbi:MAG: glycine--tRNA ligase [Candidatus Bathyarchaeia archaeon]
MPNQDKYETLMDIAKRRGFFWPSFEIYGGVGGFIDLGPLGTKLMKKIENKWREFFIKRLKLLEITTPIVMPHKVFEISGHVEHFKDPMVECSRCERKYRADHLLREFTETGVESLTLEELGSKIKELEIRCPECKGMLSNPRYFFTMFTTTIGPYSQSIGYARPETAQGIFIDFKRVFEVARERFPLGIAQIGRVLRNEISPRQGPIRLREFTIMEFEFFFDPEDPACPMLDEAKDELINIVPLELRIKGIDEALRISIKEALKKKYILTEWLAYFMALSKIFVSELGIPEERQRFHEKLPNERAHYSIQTYDHEVFLERWGWVELAGHAYRTDYDLSRHMEGTGEDLRVFKAYEKPITKRIKTISPILSSINQTFKEDSQKVIELLNESNAEEVEKSINEKSYFEVDGFKILPNHVEIKLKEIKEYGKKFIPHVVEPSFGAERLVYATLEHAHTRIKDRDVLKIPPVIAPVQAIVLPLVSRNGLQEKAMEVYSTLLKNGFDVEYDDSGSIGRRYARADEVGIPIAITIDHQTLKDETVTIRDRDTWKQVRVSISQLEGSLKVLT